MTAAYQPTVLAKPFGSPTCCRSASRNIASPRADIALPCAASLGIAASSSADDIDQAGTSAYFS
ncbi:MAG: hypothetical protein ACJ72L_19005 [Marmoricola sp.]